MGLLDKFMYNDIFKDDLHKIGSGLKSLFLNIRIVRIKIENKL